MLLLFLLLLFYIVLAHWRVKKGCALQIKCSIIIINIFLVKDRFYVCGYLK